MELKTTSDQPGYMETETEKINNNYPGCLKVFEQAVVKNKSSYLDELLLYIPDIIINKHDVILSEWWNYSLSKNKDPLDTSISIIIDFLDKKLSSGTSAEDLKLIGSTLCLIASNELIQKMYLLSFLCPDFDYMHVHKEKFNKQIAYNSKVNDDVPTRLIPNILKRSAGSVSSNVDNKKMKETDNISSRRKQNIHKRLASLSSDKQNDSIKKSAIQDNHLSDLQKINQVLEVLNQDETLDESINNQTNVNLEKSTEEIQIISDEENQINHQDEQSSSIEKNRLNNDPKENSQIKKSIIKKPIQLKIEKKIDVFKKNIVHPNNINNSVQVLIRYIPSGNKRLLNIVLPSKKISFYELLEFLKIPLNSTSVFKVKDPTLKTNYFIQVKDDDVAKKNNDELVDNNYLPEVDDDDDDNNNKKKIDDKHPEASTTNKSLTTIETTAYSTIQKNTNFKLHINSIDEQPKFKDNQYVYCDNCQGYSIDLNRCYFCKLKINNTEIRTFKRKIYKTTYNCIMKSIHSFYRKLNDYNKKLNENHVYTVDDKEKIEAIKAFQNETTDIDKNLQVSIEASIFEFDSCKFYDIPTVINSSGLKFTVPLISSSNANVNVFIKHENIISIQAALFFNYYTVLSFFINETGSSYVKELLEMYDPIDNNSSTITIALSSLSQSDMKNLEIMYPNKLLKKNS